MQKNKCKQCGKEHGPDHPHILSKLTDRGFPTHSKRYDYAHKEANKAEKKKYPKGYEDLKQLDRGLSDKHELIGKNTKAGKIEVSKKVPKKYRDEVAYHEKVENKILRKKGK